MEQTALEVVQKSNKIVQFPHVYKPPTDPKSFFIDPTNILNFVGTKAKPSAISYTVLRAMAIRAKPVAAIIHTRLNQVARFARRPSYQGDTGFKITLKDPDKEPTEAQKKRAKQIEEALLTTGFIKNRKRKDNFNMFLRKLVRDSLVLDAMAFENVYSRRGQLVEWWAVDGATIEMVVDMAVPNGEFTVYEPVTKRGYIDRGNIAYVQRIFGEVTAEYTEDELAYAIRNPRTDVDLALFGLSELEILIETVTNILNAERYNGAYFSHSNLPQGVLEIVGKYEQEHLEAFKRAWEALISGAIGKWKVPIMALEEGQGLKFTPFKQSSRDMEFHQWLEFLTGIACAVYQIDPVEIGFKPYSAGRSSGQRSEAEASRFDQSKDRGFFPLMQFLSEIINFEIVDRIDPEYKFEWVGLNEEDHDHREKMRNDRIASGFSVVAEERAAEDKKPIEDLMRESGLFEEDEIKQIAKWSYFPANQVLMSAIAQHQQWQQQNQQMQGQQEFDGKQKEADRQHQLQLLEKQHMQDLEKQGYSHEKAKEMAKVQAEEDIKKLDMQMSGQKDLENTKLNGQKELTTLQLNNQKDLQKDQQEHDLKKTNLTHQQNLETQAYGHANQRDLMREMQPDDDEKRKKLRKSLNDDDEIITIEIELE